MQQSPQNSSKIITSFPKSSFSSVKNDQLNSLGKKYISMGEFSHYKYFNADNN